MTTPAFYNRDRESRSLQLALRSKRSELLILYGRRGVGKSALLQRVLDEEGTPFLYYRAVRRTMPLQLAALTDEFRNAFPNVFLPQAFSSFAAFLDGLVYEAQARENRGETSPVCVVIDELPYLAGVDAGLLTVLQHWWDDNKRRPNLKLFLAGSYVAFMERQVLDVNAPLYNRRTGAMLLEPLDYAEAGLFFPDYSPQEKMSVWGILGGMPSYLEQFDPALGIEQNLLSTALRQNTYLAQEPDWLLLEDLRRDVVYGSILRSVAMGERKPSDIAKAIGKDSAQDVAPHLAMLQDLGLLIREVPITEKRQARSRNSLYYLADNYLDFWYRFIDPARSLIAREKGKQHYENTIAPHLGEFLSRPAFERACRQWLWRQVATDALPEDLHFTEVGTWWGAGDREIDVVALNEKGETAAAGSCKWTNAPMDVSEYAALQRDLTLAGLDNPPSGGHAPHLFLFSKNGFTPRLEQLAASQTTTRLTLVDLPTMYISSNF